MGVAPCSTVCNKIEFVQSVRHVILSGYFIKRMRPTRPEQNVTQVTRMMRMTRPISNAG